MQILPNDQGIETFAICMFTNHVTKIRYINALPRREILEGWDDPKWVWLDVSTEFATETWQKITQIVRFLAAAGVELDAATFISRQADRQMAVQLRSTAPASGKH